MSARLRLTLCAAAAGVLTALSLGPLTTPRDWLAEAVLLILLTTALGLGARRLSVPRPLTALVQLVAGLLVVTALLAGAHAPGGFLPGPQALARLGGLLRGGVTDAGQYTTPAPATDGIRMLLLSSVGTVAVLVDLIAVGYRRAALGGLPLLALYSVAASLAPAGGGWLWFLLAALGYLLLLFAEGRDRLSRWGRVFSGRGRGPAAGGTARGAGGDPQLRAGGRIGVAALGIALVLPLLLPDLGGGLFGDDDEYRRAHAGPNAITAVNPLVNLQDALNQPDDANVLSYRTDAPDPSSLYLRITALDDFNGTTWKPAARRVEHVPDPLPSPTGLGDAVHRSTVHTTLTSQPDYAQSWLPLPENPTAVSAPGHWRYEPVGRVLIGRSGQTAAHLSYRATSLDVQPTREQLVHAGAPPKRLREEFTRLPKNVPAVVKQDARKVTAHARSPYARAVALQDWFADSGLFSYDTSVHSGSGARAMARFLSDKAGFCEHYASTMAVMARYLGIPARVAVGFVPGTPQTGGTYRVGVRDAHAWPELYFEGAGWVRFEPTPSRGVQPSYTFRTPGGGGGDDASPDPAASGEATPSPTPSASRCAQGAAPCGAAAQQEGPRAGGGGSVPVGPIAAGAAGLVAVLAMATGPALLRRRTRRRRLSGTGAAADADGGSGGAGGPDGAAVAAPGAGSGRGGTRVSPEAVAAHVLELWRELLDSAWDLGTAVDESLTPRRSAARLVEAARLDGDPAAAVRRVAEATERALYAPAERRGSADPAALAADVAVARRALGAAAGRRARLRAAVLPRSTVRVVWRFLDVAAARRTAVTARLGRVRPVRGRS